MCKSGSVNIGDSYFETLNRSARNPKHETDIKRSLAHIQAFCSAVCFRGNQVGHKNRVQPAYKRAGGKIKPDTGRTIVTLC